VPALERQEKKMKKRFYFVIVVFLFFSKIFAYEIEDFSNCEWLDNISVEYIINYQKPILDKYDIVSFSFPKKNNSVNYKDWGYYRISGIGGVGAIYSVSKKEDNMFVFEYGYYPSSSDSNEKPVKLSEPNICTVYIQNENTLILVNPPLGIYRKTLYRKNYAKNSNIKMEDGVVNNLNVKIRLEPNTKGIILGKLQTGDNVKILKQSEHYEADGKHNYWYQIQLEGYPICWIFGEYVSKRDDYFKDFGVIK